jgi:hypothetical protein
MNLESGEATRFGELPAVGVIRRGSGGLVAGVRGQGRSPSTPLPRESPLVLCWINSSSYPAIVAHRLFSWGVGAV